MLTSYGTAYVAKLLVAQATPPLGLYLAFTTNIPSALDTGSTLAEPTAADYARYSLGVDTFWSAPLVGQDTTYYQWTIDIFPVATWGSILGYAICDALTAGNAILVEELPTPITMGAGQHISVDSNSLRIRTY